MANQFSTELKEGAITLLDILGWKGIWNRRKDDPLKLLNKLISTNSSTLNDILTHETSHFAQYDWHIISISDTIAFVSFGDCAKALDLHGMFCSVVIPDFLKNGLPLRGATSYGPLAVMENTVVGPAVDEVASWYESINWIGVNLCPSATYRCEFGTLYDLVWKPYKLAVKNCGVIELPCSTWPYSWTRTSDRNQLCKLFVDMAPITPDIAIKTETTLTFYDYIIKILGEFPKRLPNNELL